MLDNITRIDALTPYDAWYESNQIFLKSPDIVKNYYSVNMFTDHMFVISISNYTLNSYPHYPAFIMHPSDVGYKDLKMKLLASTYQIDLSTIDVEAFKKYDHTVATTIRFNSKKKRPCLENITIKKMDDVIFITIFSRATEMTMRFYADLIYIDGIITELSFLLGFRKTQVHTNWIIVGPSVGLFQGQIFWELFSKQSLHDMPNSRVKEVMLRHNAYIWSDKEYKHQNTRIQTDFIRNNKITIKERNK